MLDKVEPGRTKNRGGGDNSLQVHKQIFLNICTHAQIHTTSFPLGQIVNFSSFSDDGICACAPYYIYNLRVVSLSDELYYTGYMVWLLSNIWSFLNHFATLSCAAKMVENVIPLSRMVKGKKTWFPPNASTLWFASSGGWGLGAIHMTSAKVNVPFVPLCASYENLHIPDPKTVWSWASTNLLKVYNIATPLGWHFGSAACFVIEAYQHQQQNINMSCHKLSATEPKFQSSMTTESNNHNKFWKWRFS